MKKEKNEKRVLKRRHWLVNLFENAGSNNKDSGSLFFALKSKLFRMEINFSYVYI